MVLVGLACGSATPAIQTVRPATEITTPTHPIPTLPAESLWYLTRGDTKSDQAWGVDTDASGNVYMAAYMQQPATRPFYDMVVYKFNPNGEEMWQTQWGGEFQEKAFIVVVNEPVVYVGGLAHTAMAMIEADMALLALDSASGEILWTFTWGQGFGYEELDGLVVDGEDIFISGWTTSETTGGDLAIHRLRRDGSVVWTQTWGTEGFDSADGQMVVDESSIYVSGRVEGENMLWGGDAALVQFDRQSGAYLAHTTWGGPSFDDGFGMTSDGEALYMVGLTIAQGNGQIFVLKYTKTLELEWERLWGGAKGESARVLEVDPEGNILVAGSTLSQGAGSDDVALLCYNPKGDLLWEAVWGGPRQEAIHGLAIAGEYVYLAGNTESFGAGMDDDLLIKVGRREGQFPPVIAGDD
jgi:hypothetical protein